ncbi:MAG TPA: MFS transporter [Candidatus Cryosericum sp.]|nr:MFS transporter [Candidatus Cryosericum sp.]
MNQKRSDSLLFAAIVCVAVNLRAPITAVGPLMPLIKAGVAFPSGVLGLLTTIPLIMFAVVSPFVCRISDRFGAGKTLLAGILFIGLGIALRSYAGAAGLFGGTVLLGFGVALGNVLIPGVIKARFPARVGLVTSAFTISMGSFAAVSAAVSYPVSQLPGFGWRNSLAVWLALFVFALAAWWPQRKLSITAACPADSMEQPQRSVFSVPRAWWLTLLMGAQSFLFYFFAAWLPTLLQSKGITPEHAGLIAFAYQLMTIPVSFIIPAVAVRLRNQKGLITVVSAVYALSIALLYFAKSGALATVAVMLCGLSTGSCFSLCMLLIGLRAHSAARATSLSGMVQSLGYAFGAVGPILGGWLLDWTGGWNAAILCAAALTVVIFLSGRKAGENAFI